MNKKLNEKKKIYRSTWDMDYYFMRHLHKLLKPLVNPAILYRNLKNAADREERITEAFLLSEDYYLDSLYFGFDKIKAQEMANRCASTIRGLPEILDESRKKDIATWLHVHTIEYLKAGSRIINLDYHKFEYEGKTKTQKEMIELLIDTAKSTIGEYADEEFAKLMNIWAIVHTAMWW